MTLPQPSHIGRTKTTRTNYALFLFFTTYFVQVLYCSTTANSFVAILGTHQATVISTSVVRKSIQENEAGMERAFSEETTICTNLWYN